MALSLSQKIKRAFIGLMAGVVLLSGVVSAYAGSAFRKQHKKPATNAQLNERKESEVNRVVVALLAIKFLAAHASDPAHYSLRRAFREANALRKGLDKIADTALPNTAKTLRNAAAATGKSEDTAPQAEAPSIVSALAADATRKEQERLASGQPTKLEGTIRHLAESGSLTATLAAAAEQPGFPKVDPLLLQLSGSAKPVGKEDNLPHGIRRLMAFSALLYMLPTLAKIDKQLPNVLQGAHIAIDTECKAARDAGLPFGVNLPIPANETEGQAAARQTKEAVMTGLVNLTIKAHFADLGAVAKQGKQSLEYVVMTKGFVSGDVGTLQYLTAFMKLLGDVATYDALTNATAAERRGLLADMRACARDMAAGSQLAEAVAKGRFSIEGYRAMSDDAKAAYDDTLKTPPKFISLGGKYVKNPAP